MNHREIFSHTPDAVGLKIIRIKRGRYKDTDAKCYALFYYAGKSQVYQYIVGRCYADQFHPDDSDKVVQFQDAQPYWLTSYHRTRVRALLIRFRELVVQDPAALRIMGMAAYLKLENLLEPTRRPWSAFAPRNGARR